MKIGLVTPYVYPLPGGVNEHVRFLYENLRQRGHDGRPESKTDEIDDKQVNGRSLATHRVRHQLLNGRRGEAKRHAAEE